MKYLPVIQFGMSCVETGIEIRTVPHDKRPKEKVVLTTRKAISDYFENAAKKASCTVDDLIIMCSSSMDFPDEYTDNKEIIAICNDLRR